MMKLNQQIIAAICISLGLTGIGIGARVLTLNELDEDGNTTNLDGKPLAIVDINSEIKISLDLITLEDWVVELLGKDAVSDELIHRAIVLQEASRMGLGLIDPLTQALERWTVSPKKPNDVNELLEKLHKSAEAKLKIIEIAEKDPALSARLNAAYEIVLRQRVSRATLSRNLFEAAADYAGQLPKTIDEALQKEGAYVQLGAWIIQDGQDRPLHLRGFDRYPEGDFFVVDRWTLLPLNEEQKRQLKNMESAAREVNKSGIEALLKIDTVAHGAVGDFLDRARHCLERIETELASLKVAVAEETESIRNLVVEARAEQLRYMSYVVSLKDKYGGESSAVFSSGAALLESTHADLVGFQQRTKSFISGQAQFLIELRTEVGTSTLGGSLTKAEKVIETCLEELDDVVANFTGDLSELLKGSLLSQEINTAVLEFGEEVLKLTLDKVPQSTELNLKRAGMRKAKDVVILKLAAGSAKRQRQILEERRLDLYRVLTHIEMSIGMIFADPTGTTGVQNRFQAGPSYSILLKGFGNREATYNRLLTLGFGLNVSALDFDKDDTPELGIAVVGSAFRDYLQVGYGYNVNEDVGYWFFGLRLPLPTFTLPSDQSPSLP